MKPKEVLLSSEASGQLWSVMVWDPSNGSQLTSLYKGGVSAPNTLSFIGKHYIINAEKSKPLLHVWALNRKDPLQFHTVMPSLVTALSASPDGSYCAGALGEQVNVWEVSTGGLQAVLRRHYQTVTIIKWTDDGSHLVSAGEDGIVLVWLTQQILSANEDNASPRHSWSKHSLPVTGLHVGKGGWRARVVTCSLDNTCKVFSISSGQLLLSVEMPASLTAVTVLPDDSSFFTGTQEGQIFRVSLKAPPRTLTFCPTKEDLEKNVFNGHTKRITCVDVSMSGKLLASGSDDTTVMLWDVESRQCLRMMLHHGSIGNLMFSLAPASMLSSGAYQPSVCIKPFKRVKESSGENREVNEKLQNRLDKVWKEEEEEESSICDRLGKENSMFRKANSDLYQATVQSILEEIENVS